MGAGALTPADWPRPAGPDQSHAFQGTGPREQPEVPTGPGSRGEAGPTSSGLEPPWASVALVVVLRPLVPVSMVSGD